MKLALFDLDHTLIPFDSGMAWTRFLVGAQALPPQAEAQYLDYCHQYVAGTLDIHAMHRASVAPLRAFTPRQLAQWLRQFEQEVSSRIPVATQELVRRHRDAGQICAHGDRDHPLHRRAVRATVRHRARGGHRGARASMTCRAARSKACRAFVSTR